MRMLTCIPVATLLVAFAPALSAHETEEKSSYPGFRPECERSAAFVADLQASTVRILPTIIRSPTNTVFSADSQRQIAAFLDSRKITGTSLDTRSINPGEIKGQGQFEWFQNDMAAIGEEVRARTISEDYVLVMEVLFPPAQGHRQAVFGIHCIILNPEGENVFSFLLNSHHRIFVDAGMEADDLSAESRSKLIKTATSTALDAFVLQLEAAGGPSGE